MTDKMEILLKDKPFFIPGFLFKNYNRLDISESELIILIFLINMDDKIAYNPDIIASGLNIDKFKVMEILNNLNEKKLISINVEKNKDNRREEYIYLDLLYSKLMNLLLSHEEEKTIDNSDIFSIFESEFGRTLSPMEYEIIKGWLNDNINYELLIEALKEATYNGVANLRYIDKILYEWKKKGYKTKSDVIQAKNKYRESKKEKLEVFDYNWLEDE